MSRALRAPIALVLLVAGAIIFTYTLVHALWFAPESSGPPAIASTIAAQPREIPERVIIPALGVNANVQDVGIAASGNMAVPNNFTDVAWYRYGAAPGQAGSAVIDGHVDNGLGLPGVFKNLNTIAVGDAIDVQNASTTLHFSVVDIERYPYKNVPVQQIFAATTTPMLNLITCEGVWVQGDRTYDHRLVVYARLTT